MGVKKMMLSKVKAIDYEKLNKLATDIAARNNKSKFYVKCDMIKNFIQYGIGYTDYLKSDFINLTKEEKKTHVTTKSYYKLLKYLNKHSHIVTMNDKLLFDKLFTKYLKRDIIDMRFATLEEFKEFTKNKKVLFAKPQADFGGHGIEKIVLKDVKNLEKLYKDLRKKKLFVVEEEVKQCKTLQKLNPHAVNPFRVVTLVKDGKAYVVGNALRINIHDQIVVGCDDTYMRLGEDGKISSRVINDYAVEFDENPNTGVKFKDLVFPGVKEAFEMCKEAALVVPEIRYVGWDVVLTDDGPLLLEGNEFPSYGLIQYYLFNDEREGHLATIAKILGDEMNDIDL